MHSFLVESGDELVSVEFYYDITTFSEDFRDTLMVEVNKFNLSTNLWEKVRSLNGQAIFLGSHYSLSCPVIRDSDTEEVGSCIYFTNRKDETLYSYRIEDESITLYLPCPNLPKPWLLLPIWVISVQRAESVYQHPITAKEAEVLPRENIKLEEEENNIVESMVKENFLCDLPPDLLTRISSNLSFVDYMNIRCGNKLHSSTIRMKSNSFPRPCLVFSKRDKGVFDFVDSKLHSKHTLTIPEAIEDYAIHYAKDGWLLMDKQEAITFFNPFMKEVIKFPDKPHVCYVTSSYTFTSLPSSSDCVVIAISGIGMSVHFHYIRPGDEEWRHVKYKSDALNFEPSCNTPVFHKGSFYYQGKDGRLGVLRVLEAEADAIDWRVLDQLRRPCNHFQRNYLVECGGNLLSVFEGRKGKRVWVRVFKLINDDEDWQEIKSLGNYSFYLSRYSSIASVEERPDMANRIYFPRFYQDGLVYYCMNTKKYHSFGSDDLLDNFYGTTMYTDCAWVEPKWP